VGKHLPLVVLSIYILYENVWNRRKHESNCSDVIKINHSWNNLYDFWMKQLFPIPVKWKLNSSSFLQMYFLKLLLVWCLVLSFRWCQLLNFDFFWQFAFALRPGKKKLSDFENLDKAVCHHLPSTKNIFTNSAMYNVYMLDACHSYLSIGPVIACMLCGYAQCNTQFVPWFQYFAQHNNIDVALACTAI